MRRREFIAYGTAAALCPLAAYAQQRAARIGFFTPQSPDPSWIEAFRAGMSEHGYFEGRNLTIALRSADGEKERYTELINELLSFRPDVMMTWSTPTSMALKTSHQHHSNCFDFRRPSRSWTGGEPCSSSRKSHRLRYLVRRRRDEAVANPKGPEP